MKPKIVCIVGPTASGKTDVSIRIAKAFDGEIICADSMQIYQELQIGTAKPSIEEQAGIPHHLFGIVPPDGEYNVARYKEDAENTIQDILDRGKLPIIVGGTGLYINALSYALDFTAQAPDQAFRDRIAEEYDTPGGAERLYKQMIELDPASADRIHMNDKKRLIRRLEILSGEERETYSFREPQQKFNMLRIGINKDRARLYSDINKRVDIMAEMGLETEVTDIYRKYGSDIQAFKAIGYKEFLPYFEGDITIEKTLEIIKRNTRRYAKRQLTWFRRESDIRWFYVDSYTDPHERNTEICHCVQKFLEDKGDTIR